MTVYLPARQAYELIAAIFARNGSERDEARFILCDHCHTLQRRPGSSHRTLHVGGGPQDELDRPRRVRL